MKKLAFAALAVLILAGCAKNDVTETAVTPAPADRPQSQTPGTYAANDLFNVSPISSFWWEGYHTFCSDAATNSIYGAYGKSDYCHILNLMTGELIFLFFPPKFGIPFNFCFDNKQNIYVVGDFGQDGMVLDYNKFIEISADCSSYVSLHTLFPAGCEFLGICSAENGNIFIRTKQPSGDLHSIYRLTTQGILAKLVDGIDAAYSYSNNYFNQTNTRNLMKANGTLIYGLDNNKNFFKANTNTGSVEYFTPRIPVLDYATALQMNNLYALSGRRIVELRPNMANDLVVGTIPDSYKNSVGQMEEVGEPQYIIYINPDATEFYISTRMGYIYKLTL